MSFLTKQTASPTRADKSGRNEHFRALPPSKMTLEEMFAQLVDVNHMRSEIRGLVSAMDQDVMGVLPGKVPSFVMKTDTVEGLLCVDLPGVLKQDVSIVVSPDRILTLQARRILYNSVTHCELEGDHHHPPSLTVKQSESHGLSGTSCTDLTEHKETKEQPDAQTNVENIRLYEVSLRLHHRFDCDAIEFLRFQNGELIIRLPYRKVVTARKIDIAWRLTSTLENRQAVSLTPIE